MRFLVTGGAGFIGSNIVAELVKRNLFVRVLDNFSTGKEEYLAPYKDKINLIRGDIREEKDLDEALEGIDCVLHQAALRAVERSVEDPLSTNEVNATGTLKLLIAAKKAGVKKVVYASSSSIYGENELFPQKELYLPAPISPYAVSKLAGEYYCRVYAKTFGIETVSLRYFNVFGPKQDPFSKYSLVIPKFITKALKKEPLEIHGDGRQSRDFTFIDNVVEANILAATKEGISGKVFNIACGKTYSVLDIAKILENILGYSLNKKHVASRPGDVKKTYADVSFSRKVLGYCPKINFEEGLMKTVEWFKAEEIK